MNMCVYCYKLNSLSFASRIKFVLQLTKIFCKLLQRKYQRINNKYNHFWVAKTSKTKSGNIFYYASPAVKLNYNGADTGESPIYLKKEYAEFMGAIFEVYQTPKNKPINKIGYRIMIENVSLFKTIALFPFVVYRIFKVNTISSLFPGAKL